MEFHEEMAELVIEMLADFGAAGTLTRSGPTTQQFNQRTERFETVAGAASAIVVQAAVGPIVVKEVDGREVTKTVATMREKPIAGDKLAWGSFNFVLSTVTVVPLQGRAVAYIAEVA